MRCLMLAALGAVLSVLLGIGVGGMVGLSISARRVDMNPTYVELFFWEVGIAGAVFAAWALVFARGRSLRTTLLLFVAAVLVGGGVSLGFAMIDEYFVDQPQWMAVALVAWGAVLGSWFGWQRGKLAAGAILGAALAGVLAGAQLLLWHPDPVTGMGVGLGALAGLLALRGEGRPRLVTVLRFAVAGVLTVVAAGLIAFQPQHWPHMTWVRLTPGHLFGSPSEVTFSPDGRQVLSVHADRICLWNLEGHRIVESLPLETTIDVTALKFPVGGHPVAVSVSRQGQFTWWDAASGDRYTKALPGHLVPVEPLRRGEDRQWEYRNPYAVALSPDGTRALVSDARLGRLWQINLSVRGLLEFSMKDFPPITSVAWAGESEVLLASGSKGTVYRVARAGEGLRKLKEYHAVIPALGGLKTSPDGRYACAYGGYESTTLLFLNLEEEGAGFQTLGELKDVTSGVAFSPDGSLLVTDGYSGEVFVWETATRRLLRRYHQHYSLVRELGCGGLGCGALAVSADNGTIIASDAHGAFSIWHFER
jgi:DNA-binding beta-propeller fold protein YncE